MSHLNRAQPDATWKRGYITVGNDLKTIDQNTFVAINGDEGGTWAPSANIVIGGAGVVVAGPWIMSGANCTVTSAAPITFGKGAGGAGATTIGAVAGVTTGATFGVTVAMVTGADADTTDGVGVGTGAIMGAGAGGADVAGAGVENDGDEEVG